MDQNRTPLADALQAQVSAEYIPFDVPGHKGNISELVEFFGDRCLNLDKNSRQSIDYLCQPSGVILEAEELAAEAFCSKHAFFMVGGTTSSIQAMVMSACSQGDKIILPRNVHSSVINAVVLSGAIPVYVNPSIHKELGISLGMCIDELKQSILRNTDAKAVLINNPTYYGICSNMAEIISLAHKNNMLVLADEAHGTHFYFSDTLPAAAMKCGADMSAVSMHKTGGSLTQSSILLSSDSVNPEYIRSIINLTRTTSASYLLLSSLDIARKKMALDGGAVLESLIPCVSDARARINAEGGYYAFGSDIIDGDAVFDFDASKLCINTSRIGLAGIEVYSRLRDEYSVQLEFGDINNILALPAVGDKPEYLDRLCYSLKAIKDSASASAPLSFRYEYIKPIIKMSPRKAFYSRKTRIDIHLAAGCISGDFIMCYPPGVPILAPGELITDEIIEHILYAHRKGCNVTGMPSAESDEINIVE